VIRHPNPLISAVIPASKSTQLATPGKDLTVSYSIVNKGKSKIQKSSVVIGLANDVTYKQSGTGAGKAASSGEYDAVKEEVVWASGAVKGRKARFWVKASVANDAQILMFDASALVELSTGEVCELEAVPSVVKVKGHKNAVPPVPGVQNIFPYASRLNADLTGANGYVERYVRGADGFPTNMRRPSN